MEKFVGSAIRDINNKCISVEQKVDECQFYTFDTNEDPAHACEGSLSFNHRHENLFVNCQNESSLIRNDDEGGEFSIWTNQSGDITGRMNVGIEFSISSANKRVESVFFEQSPWVKYYGIIKTLKYLILAQKYTYFQSL
jgi:hypothetical protein